MPYLPIQSHHEVLEVRASTYAFGGRNNSAHNEYIFSIMNNMIFYTIETRIHVSLALFWKHLFSAGKCFLTLDGIWKESKAFFVFKELKDYINLQSSVSIQ